MRRHQGGGPSRNFVNIIVNSKDMKLEDKLKILEYTADECFVKDDNLLYLECKQGIKELNDYRS